MDSITIVKMSASKKKANTKEVKKGKRKKVRNKERERDRKKKICFFFFTITWLVASLRELKRLSPPTPSHKIILTNISIKLEEPAILCSYYSRSFTAWMHIMDAADDHPAPRCCVVAGRDVVPLLTGASITGCPGVQRSFCTHSISYSLVFACPSRQARKRQHVPIAT